MAESKISLAIYGTRLPNSGWEPLIFLNNPQFPSLPNIGTPGLKDNLTYYTFRIDQNYTQYTLVYNPKNIRANKSAREGALKISISIPKGYKLADNASPLHVLIDLKRVMEQEALTPVIGHENVFEFKEDFPNDSVFANVLNSFHLISAEIPHRPMSSTSNEVGLLIINDVQEEQLFDDVQYPEFAQYKEIGVARFGQPELAIKNITFPRNPKYDIWVNNQNFTTQLKATCNYNYDYNAPIYIDVLDFNRLSRNAYEECLVRFTIEDLLNGKTNLPGGQIVVDRVRELINIILPEPKKRTVKCTIQLSGCPKQSVYDHLRVKVNGCSKPILRDNTIELAGEEIDYGKVDIGVVGDAYQVVNVSRKGTIITVQIKETEKPKVNNGTAAAGLSGRIANDNRVTNNIEITLRLKDQDDISDSNKLYSVKFQSEKRYFAQKCQFSPSKSKDFSWETSIEIPSSWKDHYAISFRTDKVKYKSSQEFNISKDTEIKIQKNDTEFLAWKDRNLKTLRMLITGCVGLLLMVATSVVSIVVYQNFKDKGSASGQERVSEPIKGETSQQETAENEKFMRFWNEFNDLRDELKKEDITFDRIREMSDWLSANEGKFTNKPELSDFTEFKGRIDAYLQVINVVESPSQNRTWAKIKEEAAKHQKQLDSVHYAYLRKIWWIGKNSKDFDVVITLLQGKKVNVRLKSDPVYHSFRDIPASKDILNDMPPSESHQSVVEEPSYTPQW